MVTDAKVRPPLWVILIVVIIAAVTSFSLIHAQFRGEDEALTLAVGERVANALAEGRLKDIAVAIFTDYHPPARNLITVPFIWLLGATEAALRLPNILGWIATAIVATLTGHRLAGLWAGLLSGVLIGGSGLFNLQAMGHGHGFLTFWLMLLVYHLLKDPSFRLETVQQRKSYIIGGIYCIIAFLWFTSAIAVAVPYHAIYGYYALTRKYKISKNLRTYVSLSLPFAAFYAFYYSVFVALPATLYFTGIWSSPVGQFHQNLLRSSQSHLNLTSLIENLQGINGYFFPFLSWFILLAGMNYLFIYNKNLFIMISLYALIMSFYISGNTKQHFLAYFSWILPWGVACVTKSVRYFRWKAIAGICVSTILVLSWSVYIHIFRYTEDNYPSKILDSTFSSVGWQNNVIRPFDDIKRDLETFLTPEDRFIVLSDGAFPLYYFRDNRYTDPK